MNSSTIEKFSKKFEVYLFKELEFLGLKFHDKLKFQKGYRYLHISKIAVDC